jgi:hypothetical protein
LPQYEPDATQQWLTKIVLAFVLAGLIGAGGNVLVRTFWTGTPADASPSTRSPTEPAGDPGAYSAPART